MILDFNAFVNKYKPMTCILSVEKLPDGSCGTIRYVAANAAYIASIEDSDHVSSSSMLSNKFEPGSEYTRYIPKDPHFEDICYSAAILGKPIHNYSRPERYPFWLNVIVMPLDSDDPNIGYCAYSLEIDINPDADRMANSSGETSADVLTTCFKLRGSGTFEENIREVVKDIGRICDAGHTCILLVDRQRGKCRMLAECIKDGSGKLSMEKYLDDSFFGITETWRDTIGGSTCYVAKDKNELDKLKDTNPLWYNSLMGANVNSIVLFPLIYNGDTMGYMWALDFDVENSVKIAKTLELSCFFIAAEISNYLLVDKLKMLSSIDLLTGIKNRNAMNIRIDEIVSRNEHKRPKGVIFADINGLKYTNDHEGHTAGDSLIMNAANLLRRICPDMELYRAGGDEFMVIVEDMDEEGFNDVVDKLKNQTDKVYLAVGGCYEPEDMDIRRAMHIADEQMYKDKERYYKRFPERRR